MWSHFLLSIGDCYSLVFAKDVLLEVRLSDCFLSNQVSSSLTLGLLNAVLLRIQVAGRVATVVVGWLDTWWSDGCWLVWECLCDFSQCIISLVWSESGLVRHPPTHFILLGIVLIWLMLGLGSLVLVLREGLGHELSKGLYLWWLACLFLNLLYLSRE